MFGTFRTFLALMVVATHLGGVRGTGAYAVFGFFCLSGYLMTLIMQSNYGYTAQGIRKYALNRFLRIYPIYWISALFSVALIWYFGDGYTSSYHESLYLPGNYSEVIQNLMLFLSFRESPRLIPPAWALTVELFYYILIGVGISKNRRITMAWFTFGVLYHIGALILHLGWGYRYFSIFAASLPFSTGALIFHYKEQTARFISKIPGWAYNYLFFIVMASILLNWWLGIVSNQIQVFFFYSNFILCAFMVAVLSSRTELLFINKKLDNWLGDFSYPIYLIHYQVGILVLVFLAGLGLDLKRADLTFMYVSIPVIFAFSWFITVTIERPIEKIRSKIKKK